MAKAKEKHPYPEKLYIRYDPADPGEEGCFLAETELRHHAEPNGKTRIAIYRLEQIGDVSAEPRFDPVK